MSRKSLGPLTLKLPSLSGLISLKNLNLSNRNIEVIPSDISNLAALEVLNLGGNSFVSLPTSINHLLRLREIVLNGCKRLQAVPELPSNVKVVTARDCVSLETLSINALKPDPFSIMFCDNCFKLLNYDGISTLLSALKKEPKSYVDKETSVVIPGSEIPKWFKHQSEGSSMKIKGDRDLKLKGYASCAVYFGHKLPPGLCKPRLFAIRCSISTLWKGIYEDDLGEGLADHLWLQYIPVDTPYKPEDWYDFELKYVSTHEHDQALEVRRCGAHPIYEEEVEELCSSYISGNLIEFHQDPVPPKFDLTDYDGAETSTRSANFDPDEPQPQRHEST